MIAVGQLDMPITIQYPEFNANANYGGVQAATWGDLLGIASIWAHIIYKGGRESEEGDQMTGESKIEFYIRYETYKDLIHPNYRIQRKLNPTGTVYYYIEKIQHIDGRHKITKLTATLKDNN